jgi:uncharacterized membrane protein YeiB
MKRSHIRRAVLIWLAVLAAGALVLMAALQWAPQLAPIAGGFVLVSAMLGLAALDFVLLRGNLASSDESDADPTEATAILEHELKRKGSGTVPHAPVGETRRPESRGARSSPQRNA